jgi:hypothetical protein
MVVDSCTKAIEAQGLHTTGIYRVPGKTAAVNMMIEELNKVKNKTKKKQKKTPILISIGVDRF